MKKIFLTGVGGQLGSEISRMILSQPEKYELVAPTRKELDLIDLELLNKVISKLKPDIIIHSAAYTNVVQAEIDKDRCYQDNVVATSNLVNACRVHNAVLVYVSTDFVFDGKISRPYKTIDITNPLSYYGYTKLKAEKIVQQSISKHFIIRTSWLFSHNEGNFLTKILAAAKNNNEISVVHDEIGSPTSTLFLTKIILNLIEKSDYGIYHVSNQGSCSRYEFALKIIGISGIRCKVNSSSSKSNLIVNRPKYSVLENNWKLNGVQNQTWTEAVVEVMNQLNLSNG